MTAPRDDQKRVICIGPNRRLKQACEDALGPADWDVYWAQNGLIALEAASLNEYDVAIVEDSLPMLSASD